MRLLVEYTMPLYVEVEVDAGTAQVTGVAHRHADIAFTGRVYGGDDEALLPDESPHAFERALAVRTVEDDTSLWAAIHHSVE